MDADLGGIHIIHRLRWVQFMSKLCLKLFSEKELSLSMSIEKPRVLFQLCCYQWAARHSTAIGAGLPWS